MFLVMVILGLMAALAGQRLDGRAGSSRAAIAAAQTAEEAVEMLNVMLSPGVTV